MSSYEPAYLTISEAGASIAAGELSPVELTEAVLRRIDQTEPRTRAYVRVLADEALAAAREAEAEIVRQGTRGPLHGIPIALKDLYDVQGVPTLCGSEARAGHVAARDCTVVERLRQAGAIFTGKTVTHQFAYGVFSPPARNPWNTERIPGGSSGGSAAAVAAAECLAAMGTDTAGSIRMPAALNGICGLKATFGRISKHGVAALAWSLDNAGPLTRSVEDAAILLQVLAGYDQRDASSIEEPVPDYGARLNEGVRGLRLGVVRNHFFDHLHPDVAAAVEAAVQVFAGLGADVLDVTVPHLEHALPVMFCIVQAEASEIHRHSSRQHTDSYAPDVLPMIRAGEFVLAAHYLRAQRVRPMLQKAFRDVYREHRLDAFLTPGLPQVACAPDTERFQMDDFEEEATPAYLRNCTPFNATGLPALMLPCGFSTDGLPIGFQISGKPFDEAMLLRVGQAYESATDWHQRRPPALADGQEG